MNSNTGEAKPVRATANTIARRVLLTLLFAGSALALLLAGSLGAGAAAVTPATPGWGVTQTPVASGPLLEAVSAKFKQDGGFGNGLVVSTVSIVKNIVVPGGYFGWHQHGGPSWIVVTQGTLTFYDGDDPACTPHPVSAGHSYFDAGDHTHNARNETGQQVENYVVRMLPAGGQSRIDMPDPGVCPGLP